MIKWIRLKNICEKICERPVHIHASTDVSRDYIAGCEFNSHNVNIILNMAENKSEEKIICSIAHEITHVLLNNKKHDILFDNEWKKVEKLIMQEYNK